MSNMDRANRQLRRASGFLGFLATLWLVAFWIAVIAVAGIIVWAVVA